jgi:hypothetical protein
MRSDLVFALSTLALAACTWDTPLPDASPKADKELVVTDDAVLVQLSSNRDGGPLSFRHAMETLHVDVAPWLDAWSARLTAEGRPARAASFDARVRCAWLRLEPANLCDATCSRCAAHDLVLDVAPFRAIAVVNRTDLSVMPDRAADGGEGRIVFALTDGPGDDPSAAALPMTVIFEYAQRGTAKEWASRWHALATTSDVDFPTALAAVTASFETDLAQLRTADALDGEMLLHQFELANGTLATAPVRNSPDWSRVHEDDLRAWAGSHSKALADGTSLLPRAWWADASSSADVAPSWLATIDEHDAVVHGTCAGCHALANGFQIDPRAHGKAKLSTFLEGGELARRTAWNAALL